MDLHERQRTHSYVDKVRTKAIGEDRMASGIRCYCGKPAPYFSAFCKDHAFRNKRWGHPELRLKINTRASQDDTRELGRVVMQAVAADDPCWGRIAGKILRITQDQALRFDIPTLCRRQSSWKTPFIAAGLLGIQSRYLVNRWGQKPLGVAEGFLESHLGMAARFFHGNELFLTSRQMVFGINKNGGRAVLCNVPTNAKDEYDPEKVWRYRKREGVITAAGRIVSETIATELGTKWWKLVSDAVAVMPHQTEREIPFITNNTTTQ